MRHLKLTVAYDGTNYVGWQIQPNGTSVQQMLEEAWHAVTAEQPRIVASGRTDSGVHALAQVCSLTTESSLTCQTLLRAINANTPDDISTTRIENAPVGFHAIRDASRKTYRYQIQFGQVRNPVEKQYRWFCRSELDIKVMERAAQFLIGEHDFASFEAAGSERNSTVRLLSKLGCRGYRASDFEYLDIEMTCNGFLYNMVRNIVGTLIKVGQGSQQPDWVKWVLEQKKRIAAGPTAPAHGLVLKSVEYDGIEFHADCE